MKLRWVILASLTAPALAVQGGNPIHYLLNTRETIENQAGEFDGVISMLVYPNGIIQGTYRLTDEGNIQPVSGSVENGKLWLDIGAKDRDEAAKAVAVGDPVTLELGYQEMRNNLANSPGMDNKTGLWVSFEALRRAKKKGGLNVALYAVATVQEEIGLRGAITSALINANPKFQYSST